MDTPVPKLLSNVYIQSIRFFLIFMIYANFFLMNTAQGRRSLGNKKKVVIIGEMADMSDFLANSNHDSSVDKEASPYMDGTEDYDDDGTTGVSTRWQHHYKSRYQKRRGQSPQKSVFVPVAAYSVTHSRVPSPGRADSIQRIKHVRDRQSSLHSAASSPGRTTESAVYGYLNRPEIVEFRGQYFYGPNPIPAPSTLHPAAASSEPPILAAPALSNKNTRTGIGPGGLLLATLPLVLAPMLSYLFTPMIIPVTATIAAGRRKRDIESTHLNMSTWSTDNQVNLHPVEPIAIPLIDLTGVQNINSSSQSSKNESSQRENDRPDQGSSPKLDEIRVVADFLQKVHFNERDRDRAMANYLQCDGLLSNGDHCLERLACEFSDPSNSKAPELDRSVTSIILSYILKNSFISQRFKQDLKSAAIHGQNNPGKCSKYKCNKIKESFATIKPRR